MVEEVWRRARRATRIDRLIIATDDRRILDEASSFGAEAVMTAVEHSSGTDRVAEVAHSSGEQYEIVVNIQGDEPLLTPASLDGLIAAFDASPRPQMATLAEPLQSVEELFDPNVVKLVTTDEGRALYFSRSPLPYFRGEGGVLKSDFSGALDGRPGGLAGYLKHQGIYAYTREALRALTAMEPSPLERDEGLEQLRALQAGFAIQVVESDFSSISVDTPEDLDRVIKKLTEVD
jgi:3-deoxy-manno-octulosonate cytidylyltransferase (CMP-KDO synthetase)